MQPQPLLEDSGQVVFVHNRIETIIAHAETKKMIERFNPGWVLAAVLLGAPGVGLA